MAKDTLAATAFFISTRLSELAKRATQERFLSDQLQALIASDEVILWHSNERPSAISGLDDIDPKRPHVQRLTSVYRLKLSQNSQPDRPDLDPASNEFPEHALWIPAHGVDGGALFLRADKEYTDAERMIAQTLYWSACPQIYINHKAGGKGLLSSAKSPRLWVTASILGLVAVALSVVDIPNSIVAESELSSATTSVVRSQAVGTIDSISVKDAQTVQKGDLLFELNTQSILAQKAILSAELEQIVVEFEQASLSGLTATADRLKISEHRALAKEKKEQLRFLDAQLANHESRAPVSGVIDMPAAETLIGKPVDIGTPVLQVVDPNALELTIKMAVGSSINVENGDVVSFIPSAAPWSSLAGVISNVSLRPTVDGDGQAFFKLTAQLDQDSLPSALELGPGELGRARVSADPVSLGAYLFRRPLASVRQFFGL